MRSKHIFRALGLSLLAALSVVAFFAASAQAVAGSYGILKEDAAGQGLATGETFSGSGGLGVLLVPTSNTEIHCEKSLVVSGKIISGPAGTALAKVLFDNCVAKALSPLESLPCVISNGGANHHITATAIILSVLHNGVRYLLAEQDEGAAFATIEWEKGTGCPLPNPITITGSYAFETSQTLNANVVVKPGNAALQTLLGDELKFGKNQSFIDEGAGTAALTGAHIGCTWGAI